MPRKRKKDKHLPERVYFKYNAYYFVDKDKKWIWLGKTLAEAMHKWANFVETPKKIYTMTQLFDRYMLEVVPLKSAASYRNNKIEIQSLYSAFGDKPPLALTPVSIYKFLDARGKLAPTAANREKSLLSHVFTMAIRWGIVADNPCKNVKRLPEIRRDRYITDEEYFSILNLAKGTMRSIIKFAYLTGLRQKDILSVKFQDLDMDKGIFILVSKTKKKLLIEWNEELKSVVEEAVRYSSTLNSTYLFPNQEGASYTSSGFRTLWQRLITRAIKESYLKEKFRFHDLRRKTATDIEQLSSRENARKLLGHTDQKTTAIYISGIEKVKPLNKK